MTASSLVAEVAAREDRGAMHRHRLDHDHGGAADRPLEVVVQMALAGQAALGHVGGVRAEGQPVLQALLAQIERREEVRKERRHRAASERTPGLYLRLGR